MKAPILIERAFRGFHNRKVNLDWLKYTIFVIAVLAVVATLVYTVVQSIRTENFAKDKACAVAYGSVDWKAERHDTNPDDSNAPVIDRCINPSNNNEVKDYPKDGQKSTVTVDVKKGN